MLCLSSIPLRRFRLVVATDVSCGALSAHSLCEPPRVAVQPSTALPSAGERVLRCVAAVGLRRTALEIATMLRAVARAALPGSLFANEVVVACLSSSHDYLYWCVWTRVQNLCPQLCEMKPFVSLCDCFAPVSLLIVGFACEWRRPEEVVGRE